MFFAEKTDFEDSKSWTSISGKLQFILVGVVIVRCRHGPVSCRLSLVRQGRQAKAELGVAWDSIDLVCE